MTDNRQLLRWASDWLDAHAEAYVGKKGVTAFDVAVRLENALRASDRDLVTARAILYDLAEPVSVNDDPNPVCCGRWMQATLPGKGTYECHSCGATIGLVGSAPTPEKPLNDDRTAADTSDTGWWRCNLDGMVFAGADYEQHRAEHHPGRAMAVSFIDPPATEREISGLSQSELWGKDRIR